MNEFGLSWAQRRVQAFHEAAGHPVAAHPRPLGPDRLKHRVAWMQEELEELAAAATLVDQTDAVIDLMYFALGTLVEMGIDGEGPFQIVHQANLRKVTSSGITSREHDGKIQKPAGWVTPEYEIASSIVSSYSPFVLVRAEESESCAAVLEMVSRSLGAADWTKGRYHQALPPLINPKESLGIPLDTVEPFLLAANAPLREEFIPIEQMSEATFADAIAESLAEFPSTFAAFQPGEVYRSQKSPIRYALIFKLIGDTVHLVDPDEKNPGLHSVHVDDLFAGVKAAQDGLHRVDRRKE
ncbi:hypothetical protein HNO81_16575 [Pseudarthrobacter sp. C4D7]|nr:hypothetical protein [Pseudarthrobacter sp. C4D7]